jgi:hypothetical protein
MAVSEQQRHALHSKLAQVLGEREAATMMELTPPVSWGDVATRQDFELVRAEIGRNRAEIGMLSVERCTAAWLG